MEKKLRDIRAWSRAQPQCHERKNESLSWTPRKSYNIIEKYTSLSTNAIADKNAAILSDSQDGKKCTVQVSTDRTWILKQRKSS